MKSTAACYLKIIEFREWYAFDIPTTGLGVDISTFTTDIKHIYHWKNNEGLMILQKYISEVHLSVGRNLDAIGWEHICGSTVRIYFVSSL